MSEPRKTCRSKSRFGSCGLPLRHDGDHAVPIGDGVWFVYQPRTGKQVGYCTATPDGRWAVIVP